ncbi:glycoside hydrolase family 3 C-terminal domain-containing protein [Oerskovia sp. M15]
MLVVVSSYPYALGAVAQEAAAVVWTSHGGQELGPGLVDVLSGDLEPTGRLAQTWWRETRTRAMSSTTTSWPPGRPTGTATSIPCTRSGTGCRGPRSPTSPCRSRPPS